MAHFLRTLALTLPLAGCISTGERDMKISPATSLSTQTGEQLTLLFPSGDVNVDRSVDDQLHASVTFYCNSESESCRNNAEKARIVHEQQGELSTLRFKPSSAYSTRHANLIYNVSVPPVSKLKVEMDAGDLNVESPTGCMEVRAGAGDVEISAPAASVGSADLDANLGDANLRTPEGYADDNRTLLVGSEIKWSEGPGDCHLKVKLQAGAINVRLEAPESEE